ncbi:MAG: tetratricopeptide repeat protein, partial [Thermodesulfovibrionales bacterium]|nr:tetratricopeptide repeat protein [Thermodesulfovibrionales bacterium]
MRSLKALLIFCLAFGLFSGCSSTPDHMVMGTLQMFAGEHEAAINSYTEEIALNPENATAYNMRGFSLAELGRLEEAMADYMRALELDPLLAAAYNNRGALYVDLEQYKAALADFDRTLELDPEFAAAYSNRG